MQQDWIGVGTPEESQRLLDAHAYFRSQGQEPQHFAPDFMAYWIRQGKTPEQIYEIACNRRRES
jgi:hypothetical protein